MKVPIYHEGQHPVGAIVDRDTINESQIDASLTVKLGTPGGISESSAPHPFKVKVASTTKTALARSLSLPMSASSFVMAGAVSNPFKK